MLKEEQDILVTSKPLAIAITFAMNGLNDDGALPYTQRVEYSQNSNPVEVLSVIMQYMGFFFSK